MPYLIGDHLVLRRLEHKADFFALGPLVQLLQRRALKQDLPLPAAVGGQDAFQLPQEGGFAAARRTAQNQKLPAPDREGHAVQRGALLLRVKEGQIPDCKRFHLRSSLTFRINGVRHSAR